MRYTIPFLAASLVTSSIACGSKSSQGGGNPASGGGGSIATTSSTGGAAPTTTSNGAAGGPTTSSSSSTASGAGNCMPTAGGPQSPKMSFFVTSVTNGSNGGNFGGLAGADKRCQMLADASGSKGKTWHAYLSAVVLGSGDVVVNARDRIGPGPWYDYRGDLVASSIAALHASQTALFHEHMLTEQGNAAPLTEHDIFTGSTAEGKATAFDEDTATANPTCKNWTSSNHADYGTVGHTNASCADVSIPSWNHAHVIECDPDAVKDSGGSGRLFCFAVN